MNAKVVPLPDKPPNTFSAADGSVLNKNIGMAGVVDVEPAVVEHGRKCGACAGQQNATGRKRRLSFLWLGPGTTRQNCREGNDYKREDNSQRKVEVGLF